MGWGYFWPQTCGRALKFNYLRRYFDSGLGHSHLLALTVAGIRWLPDGSVFRHSLARAILERTDRSSPDTRFFRAPAPTTGSSFTAITPCGPARVPLLTVRQPPERPGEVDGPVSIRSCRWRFLRAA
jgi:hypothetical protein